MNTQREVHEKIKIENVYNNARSTMSDLTLLRKNVKLPNCHSALREMRLYF